MNWICLLLKISAVCRLDWRGLRAVVLAFAALVSTICGRQKNEGAHLVHYHDEFVKTHFSSPSDLSGNPSYLAQFAPLARSIFQHLTLSWQKAPLML